VGGRSGWSPPIPGGNDPVFKCSARRYRRVSSAVQPPGSPLIRAAGRGRAAMTARRAADQVGRSSRECSAARVYTERVVSTSPVSDGEGVPVLHCPKIPESPQRVTSDPRDAHREQDAGRRPAPDRAARRARAGPQREVRRHRTARGIMSYMVSAYYCSATLVPTPSACKFGSRGVLPGRPRLG